MPHEALALSADMVETLFPFHILFNADDEALLSIGFALRDLIGPDFGEKSFTELFELCRPRLNVLSVETVKNHLRSSFIVQIRNCGTSLRGQLLVSSENKFLFVGTVLVRDADTLEKQNISLKVFPPIDLTPDIVILHKFREIELKDQKNKAKRLFEVSQSRDELDKFAHTDELTKVANRRGFWLSAEKILKEHRDKQPNRLILFLLDLDRFKAINDQFGHDVGDEVLCEVATRLTDAVGNRGLVGRLGGDEFVVVLMIDHYQNATEHVQQVLDTVNKPLTLEHLQLPLCASAGAVEVGKLDDLETAIYRADIAMYEGRASCRGGLFWFTPSVAKRLQQKAGQMDRLKTAIYHEKIVPHFQPIIDLATGELTGFEALARWHDEIEGFVRPDIFIALAEELGCLAMLDMQILRKSLNQLVVWQRAGKNYSVHVNVSAASIADSLVDTVCYELDQRNLGTDVLILELTETTIIENTEQTRNIIESLSRKGIRVQLDDFGTGYSSLTHLRNFPVTGIKIDRSFVADAHINSRSRKLLKWVVNIASDLSLHIVAEGIENQEQMDFLTSIGCNSAQGYYIGRPAEADICEQLFSQLTNKAA